MIRSFSYMYVGHVRLENLGFDGTPVVERRSPNEHLVTAFDTAVNLAQAMDRYGYDALWLAEHHFQHEGYECLPNLPMLFVHLSHLTKHLRFGSAFNITPMWHPLRLAEDFATADILTKGRAIFGVGRGYQTREVETLGGTLFGEEANREMFEEQVEIILEAFRHESFSYKGKHYTIPPPVEYRGETLTEITLVPRPLTCPIPLWQPVLSATPRGIEFMAKHDIKAVMMATRGFPHTPMQMYRDACARHGRPKELGEDVCLYVPCHIASTRETAAREMAPFYEESRKRTSPLNLGGGLSPSQLQLLANPATARQAGIATLDQVLAENRSWLYGPAEEIIESLKQLETQYPHLENILLYSPENTYEEIMVEQVCRFAEEVMPSFPNAIKTTSRLGNDKSDLVS